MLTPIIILVAASLGAPSPSPAWNQACDGVADFWPDACELRFDNAYHRGLCLAAQEKARKESHVRLQGVRTKVVYNAKMQRFEVTVPALFSRDIRIGACAGAACVSRVVVGKYLTWPIKPAHLAGKLAELDRGSSTMEKPFARFNVPLADVSDPVKFDKRLRVDVLFKVLRASTAREPGRLEAHAIYGVPSGIRATLQDGVWSREIRTPPKKAHCLRPANLGKRSPAEIAARKKRPRTRIAIGTTEPVPAPPDKPVAKKATANVANIDRREIASTIDHHSAAIRVCYNKELGQQPKLAGKLTFQFTIRRDGKTTGVKETERTLKSDSVSLCIKTLLRGMRFPRMKSAPITIVYPFVFGS